MNLIILALHLDAPDLLSKHRRAGVDRVKEVPAARQKAGTKTSERSWSLEERGGLVNSPPCLSFMTDAEAQPLTTFQGWEGRGGLFKHVE